MATQNLGVPEVTRLYEQMMQGTMPQPREATYAIGAMLHCIQTLNQELKAQRALTDLFQWKAIDLSHTVARFSAEKALWQSDWKPTSHDSLITENMTLKLELLDMKHLLEKITDQEQQKRAVAVEALEDQLQAMRLDLANKGLLELNLQKAKSDVVALKAELATMRASALVREELEDSMNTAVLSTPGKKKTKKKTFSTPAKASKPQPVISVDAIESNAEAESMQRVLHADTPTTVDACVQTVVLYPDWFTIQTDSD